MEGNMYCYRTSGVCSSQILFDVKNGKLTNVQFVGGCPGNTAGIAKLVEGMDIDEVIARLKGIKCRPTTSCPDQLANALIWYKQNINNKD